MGTLLERFDEHDGKATDFHLRHQEEQHFVVDTLLDALMSML